MTKNKFTNIKSNFDKIASTPLDSFVDTRNRAAMVLKVILRESQPEKDITLRDALVEYIERIKNLPQDAVINLLQPLCMLLPSTFSYSRNHHLGDVDFDALNSILNMTCEELDEYIGFLSGKKQNIGLLKRHSDRMMIDTLFDMMSVLMGNDKVQIRSDKEDSDKDADFIAKTLAQAQAKAKNKIVVDIFDSFIVPFIIEPNAEAEGGEING